MAAVFETAKVDVGAFPPCRFFGVPRAALSALNGDWTNRNIARVGEFGWRHEVPRRLTVL